MLDSEHRHPSKQASLFLVPVVCEMLLHKHRVTLNTTIHFPLALAAFGLVYAVDLDDKKPSLKGRSMCM